ncbi:hypothetical protein MBLNU13_g09880t1 [Cladosporium sp. NU13]
MADRAPSPTPSERERLDKAAKAKEQEEQSKLPYKWTQTIADLEVTIEIPGNFKGKDLDVKIAKNSVKAGIKGQDAIIEGTFPHPILLDDSTWTLESTPSGAKELSIQLAKANKMEWWEHVVTSAPRIDVSKISPEDSKLSDLDGETRGMVEKMMYDQRQKEQGKPSSDEEKKAEIMRKFQAQHPEMDFSNVKMS